MSDNPYHNPGTPATQSTPDTVHGRFIPPNVLCTLATVGLIAHAGLFLCSATLDVAGELMFPGFSDPNKPYEAGLEQSIVMTQLGIFIFSVLIYIFNIVIVCMFMYRANTNVRALGTLGLQNMPGWCGGYWFIPILNLFKPYQCMKEIYQASSMPGGSQWKSATSHPLMGVWWGCWLIGGFATRAENRMALNGVDLGSGKLVLSFAIVFLMSTAALSLVVILRSITSMQSNPQLKPQSHEKFGPIE